MRKNYENLAEFIVNQQSKSLALPLWYRDIESVKKVINASMNEKQVYAIRLIEESGIVHGRIRDDNWNTIEISKEISQNYYKRSREIVENDERL